MFKCFVLWRAHVRTISRLLESSEGGAELAHGGVGDGLADRLVDLLAHVRRQLVHGARGRAHAPTTRPPNMSITLGKRSKLLFFIFSDYMSSQIRLGILSNNNLIICVSFTHLTVDHKNAQFETSWLINLIWWMTVHWLLKTVPTYKQDITSQKLIHVFYLSVLNFSIDRETKSRISYLTFIWTGPPRLDSIANLAKVLCDFWPVIIK